MIEQESLIEVGRINRLHGLQGEMNVAVSNPVFDHVAHCPYFVIQRDGIFVPFFIVNYRFRSQRSMLLRLEDIDTQVDANTLCGETLWFHRRCFTPEEAAAYDAENDDDATDGLTGYLLNDLTLGTVGTITAIDDQTANVLFIVASSVGTELLIPAAGDLIVKVDHKARTVYMDLPPGLVNLDDAEVE